MSARANDPGHDASQQPGLLSQLGRVVKERVKEFAGEARGEIDGALRDAREDLELELGDGTPRRNQPPDDASGDEPTGSS